jgi:hypothetical protein
MATRKTTTSTKVSTTKTAAKAKPTTVVPKAIKTEVPATTMAAKAAKAPKTPKAPKAKKVKLVRDSFTMPSSDYALLANLKLKALESKLVLKKSELLRAGLHALSKLDSKQLGALVGTLAVVKTGRPKK